MFGNMLRNLGGRILWKFLKIIVIVIIAFITWETVVKKDSLPKGRKVYNETKELYRDINHIDSTPTYRIKQDSSHIYIYQK